MCLGKNAAFVRLVRCRSLEEEYSNKSCKLQEIGKNDFFLTLAMLNKLSLAMLSKFRCHAHS